VAFFFRFLEKPTRASCQGRSVRVFLRDGFWQSANGAKGGGGRFGWPSIPFGVLFGPRIWLGSGPMGQFFLTGANQSAPIPINPHRGPFGGTRDLLAAGGKFFGHARWGRIGPDPWFSRRLPGPRGIGGLNTRGADYMKPGGPITVASAPGNTFPHNNQGVDGRNFPRGLALCFLPVGPACSRPNNSTGQKTHPPRAQPACEAVRGPGRDPCGRRRPKDPLVGRGPPRTSAGGPGAGPWARAKGGARGANISPAWSGGGKQF